MPGSLDCCEDGEAADGEHRAALGWGIRSPVSCRSGAVPPASVLAPLAPLPCHVCESARVDPAMQVINADDVGELFQ